MRLSFILPHNYTKNDLLMQAFYKCIIEIVSGAKYSADQWRIHMVINEYMREAVAEAKVKKYILDQLSEK